MGQIVIYQTQDSQTQVEVQFEDETFWLNQYQLAELFNTDRTSILKHLQNIYTTGELTEASTCAKFAQVRQEGKRKVNRQVLHYNLDAILSVGYRVNSIRAVSTLKKQLMLLNEATELFGNEKDNGFKSSIQSIVQTFGGQYLYPNIEEQAAHLLYFIIKNHSFTDGNKRKGAFLSIWFLEKNKHRFKINGEIKINDNGLTALTLLVAQSDPKEKELMIKLIVNLINDGN